MDSRARAKHLLNHYFTLALRRAGVKADSDTSAEVEEIVDAIIEASAEETKKQILAALRHGGGKF